MGDCAAIVAENHARDLTMAQDYISDVLACERSGYDGAQRLVRSRHVLAELRKTSLTSLTSLILFWRLCFYFDWWKGSWQILLIV